MENLESDFLGDDTRNSRPKSPYPRSFNALGNLLQSVLDFLQHEFAGSSNLENYLFLLVLAFADHPRGDQTSVFQTVQIDKDGADVERFVAQQLIHLLDDAQLAAFAVQQISRGRDQLI